MRWLFGRADFDTIARAGVLSVLAATAACGNDDVASPGIIGGQWFDAAVAEDVVSPLDLFPAGFVVDGAGAPIASADAVDLTGANAGLGAHTSVATNVGNLQVLFNEPLNPDVIQDLVINSDRPVDLENGPFNRQSEFNPGIEDIVPRTGLVDIVRVSTGEHFAVESFYLDNIRRNVSEVTPDVGLQLFPLDVLPSNEEFQIRVYAGVIEDRDGNKVQGAPRQSLPGGVGRPETVGVVTESDGRPIAAVLGFLTDAIEVAAVAFPVLPVDDDGVPTSLVTEDDPETFENETALVVDFNTPVEPAGVEGAFILTAVGDPATPIPFTVIPYETGSTVDENGDPDPEAEAEAHPTSVQIVPTVPLAEGDYELRIDPTYEDTYGSAAVGVVQVEPFTVE
ncbi:MAG: hypothetical protein ACAI38_03385 [Myxococcota bacterium]